MPLLSDCCKLNFRHAVRRIPLRNHRVFSECCERVDRALSCERARWRAVKGEEGDAENLAHERMVETRAWNISDSPGKAHPESFGSVLEPDHRFVIGIANVRTKLVRFALNTQ